MYRSTLPIERLKAPSWNAGGVAVSLLRLDLTHPEVSGNKLFKLRYNLEAFHGSGKKKILTFGGAFSNHIAATAAACKEEGIPTIGIIRGESIAATNPTLKRAAEQGMDLHFVSRELYRDKEALLQQIQHLFPVQEHYYIPEGGANLPGLKGCAEILQHAGNDWDLIACACGTGTTLAGMISALPENKRALGFQVLKGREYLQGEVAQWLNKLDCTSDNWAISEDYHFGGYARVNEELKNFAEDFRHSSGIPLDLVYTAKMMFGIQDLIRKGQFPTGTRILALHTGGLQGNQGFASSQD